VFGIVGVCPAIKAEKDYNKLKELALEVLNEKIEAGAKSFKVESRRGDKSLPLTSQEMSLDIAGFLVSQVKDAIKVDVRNPQVRIKCEYRQSHVMVYSDTIEGYGGLPLGTNGRAMSLLSGGIDSPVASWMVAKRGMELECIHFHSYPFTSEKSQEKVRDLANILSKYCGRLRLHKVNILEIQKAIGVSCKEEEMTIISRRFMMKIAQRVAESRNCDALVTGESIGQVASQTIQGLTCTNASVSMPVFRPLIAMDKTEIIDIAQKIGTFETSILPEEDCCTVFSPKKPVTKPKLDRIEKSESKLDVEKLIQDAIDNIEIEDIEF
jgi:thiamine biosynthesis protein ThiI